MEFYCYDYFVKALSISLNFSGWIKLIWDKIIEIYKVKNEFDPTCEVQGNGNGVLQNSR